MHNQEAAQEAQQAVGRDPMADRLARVGACAVFLLFVVILGWIINSGGPEAGSAQEASESSIGWLPWIALISISSILSVMSCRRDARDVGDAFAFLSQRFVQMAEAAFQGPA